MRFICFWPFVRLRLLLDEIAQEEENKTIVFAETKKKVDNLTREMRKIG